MSYILDALKKAETERQLGSVPNLHAQPAFATPQAASRPPRRTLSFGLLALVSVCLVVALGWLALRIWQKPSAVEANPPQAIARAVIVPPVAANPTPAPTPAPPAASAQKTEPQQSRPEPASPSSPKPAKATPSTQAPKAGKAVQATKAAPTVDAGSATAQTTVPSSEVHAVALHELPENIRREIPAFSVNGYIYAANQSDRTVLINRKLLREGDQVAPGLSIEKLLPSGMVLNYKGYRYRSSY